MARFIQHELFDFAVASGAGVCKTDDAIARFSARVAADYSSSYEDENLGPQLADAIRGAHSTLAGMQIERALGIVILANFAYYVKRFDRAGKKLSVFSKLGGTRFHFERQPIPNLAADFSARFSVYAAYAHVGMLKPEWVKPENR